MSKKRLFICLALALCLAFAACTPGEQSDTPAKSVTLNYTELTLTVGESFTLTASVLPLKAQNKELEWTTSAPAIASIDGGVVTALSEGAAIITAKTTDGKLEASCEVTVEKVPDNAQNPDDPGGDDEPETPPVAVTGITLNYDTLTIYEGKSLTLSAMVEPAEATDKSVTWTSSAPSVVTVDGGTITTVIPGEATITAKTSDGGFEATCAVTVLADTTSGEDDYDVDEGDSDILIISAAGEYTLSRNYKQIYVDAPGAEVVINLNGKTIENDENSPIFVASCDSIDLSATKSTVSYIKDTRAAYVEDEDGQGKGAIYVADGDLKLKGKGTLYIEAGYYNGIHGKDDVEIKNLTLNITAVHHGVKGNDSVTVESGTLNILCGGDGLHTENSDISSKGNQRGNVTISGGSVTINSWGDAIAASYNAVVEQIDGTIPTSLHLYTNKYSSYTGQVIETSSSDFYIRMNSSAYSNGNYTYAAYIAGNWYKAAYVGTQSSSGGGGRPGGSSTYYVYKIAKPQDATGFTLYRFSGRDVNDFSGTYNAVSDAKAFNSAYDMVQISVSRNSITFGNWSNYSSSSTGSDVSAKGIKAENEIFISAGVIDIKAYDDAIHANNDGSLENGSVPLGNVTISGGNITINSADDAVHADYILKISGGRVNISTSYEGLEGNLIIIEGGETFVTATDDGVNASGGNSSPAITVSGGYLDVTVPSSGDTDGIDSNGSYTQT
ncbi:MAG: carbohydrate-binding domain-containing protein, partial [Clostridia bacterium]|nr:carbohydrate-binding domain-containing protein [Clostridia bacterium]